MPTIPTKLHEAFERFGLAKSMTVPACSTASTVASRSSPSPWPNWPIFGTIGNAASPLRKTFSRAIRTGKRFGIRCRTTKVCVSMCCSSQHANSTAGKKREIFFRKCGFVSRHTTNVTTITTSIRKRLPSFPIRKIRLGD